MKTIYSDAPLHAFYSKKASTYVRVIDWLWTLKSPRLRTLKEVYNCILGNRRKRKK